jgi:hypothetical protein
MKFHEKKDFALKYVQFYFSYEMVQYCWQFKVVKSKATMQ